MQKMITCYKSGEMYILCFNIAEINSNLRFIYEIYKIKNKSKYKFIEESFKKNPETPVFQDIIGDLEKVFINSLSQIEVGEELSKFSIDYNNLQNQGTLRLPKLTLNIENYKLGVVYSILKFFFENYDTIKLKLSSAAPNEIKSNLKLSYKKIELSDIMKLINNNLVIYYLHTYLNHFHYNSKYNKFELNNRTLKLYINNIMSDNNTVDSKNIYLLICNITETEEEVNNSLQLLFKTLIKVINNELLPSESIDEELLIKLNVLNFLCIIYGIKFIFGTKISYEKLKYLNVLNNIYLQLLKNYKLNNLEFDRIEFYESLEMAGGEIDSFVNLETISKKYKYLIKLSSDDFIKAILKDIKSNPEFTSDTNNNKFNNTENLILNNPKILNIEYLLTLDNTNDSQSLINYKKVTVPDFIKLEKKFVISEEYLQILYLINSQGFIDHSKLNFKVVKLADLIINDILPLTEKYHEMLISTLIIMNNIIETSLKDKIMIDSHSKLFILYKIILPHLYNKYSISKFIDYFL